MAAEKNFENKIKKYIEEKNGWQVKFFANRMTKSGIPDILSCINGNFLAIEVKAQNGKPSELQKHQLKQILAAGGMAIILYPQDWELFKELINDLSHGNRLAAWAMVAKINERSN